MSNLVVIRFKSEDQAAQVLDEVADLQKQNLIKIDDAATVIRNAAGKVKTSQANNLVGAGAMGGAFWGMLFGLLFFVPFLGLAIGAASGALAGKASDYGINDDFIKKVSRSIQPGNSALFLLVEHAQVDKIIEHLKPFKGEIIHTSLSEKEETKLKEAFAA
ncbi:MAG TPA: DUF1269 domain-containing protein [Candidatus Saccharimonadia bacterium]|nr:DUF1269 domain-containing protein [Candidatus Saccharimonadia bacterium]